MSGNGCVFFPLRVCRRLGVYFLFGSGVIGVIGVQSNSEPELRGIVTLLWMVSRERIEVHGYSRCLPSPLFLSPYICVLNPSHESNLGAGVTAHGSRPQHQLISWTNTRLILFIINLSRLLSMTFIHQVRA